MHILHIASGNFFSTYGGGQVYVQNVCAEMATLSDVKVSVLSFVESPSKEVRHYNDCDIYECKDTNDAPLTNLIKTIAPNIIHAHSRKAQICRIGKTLSIPVVVTAHHGGIVCPAASLLNSNYEICQTTVSHKNCLKCVLGNTRGGVYVYPILRLFSERFLLKFGTWLQKRPFFYYLTPVCTAGLHIQKKIEEWQDIINLCKIMIAPCNAIAVAMQRNGLPIEKTIVIPHGIPLQTRRALSSSNKHCRKFYYIGRICHIKGIHIMLEAFHGLSHNDIELHIIGGTGNKRDFRYMERLQKKYATDNRIRWYDTISHEHLENIVKDFDVMIHPAVCLEIFGLNISEALAVGKPVLATRCGGAEMQIEDGKNGWLVPPNDVEAIRQKIEEIIQNGFSFEPKDFKVVSIEKHCSELYNVYKATIDNCL